MDERKGYTLWDPKLPTVNAGSTGNGMEARRCAEPLPADLTDAGAQQNLSL